MVERIYHLSGENALILMLPLLYFYTRLFKIKSMKNEIFFFFCGSHELKNFSLILALDFDMLGVHDQYVCY